METLNHILNSIFDGLLGLFASLDPAYGLLVISVITGILMLIVFRYTSDQKGIKRAKNLVKAHFLATRLYKDDIAQMLATMKNIIVSNLFYMSKSVKPMLFMLVPVGLVLIQLDSRYEHRPFKVGESTVITVRQQTSDEANTTSLDALAKISLSAPSGIKIETPAIRIPGKAEVSWRIKMEQEGSFDLLINDAGREFQKRVFVSNALTALSPSKDRKSFSASLFSPAEPSLPSDAPVES
ncbi:hypothetical protein L0152_14025, partial [bacterium]|nr:hypothetical protein [bacterium]